MNFLADYFVCAVLKLMQFHSPDVTAASGISTP